MNHDAPLPISTEVSRRVFLAAGSAGVMGLSLREILASQRHRNGAVIQIVLNGGASHLETFDPKPHAPREIRGPLHSIATKVPGLRFSECLPHLAERADQFVTIRSLYHEAAPIHESGLQLLLSGRLARKQFIPPRLTKLLNEILTTKDGKPSAIELGKTALHSHSETGISESPVFQQAPRRVQEAYGETRFGELLWTAARQLEQGVRYQTVHTFANPHKEKSWDAHACPQVGPASVFDYRDTLGPQFDKALAALIDDLQQTGQWSRTLVVCAGEMGRTPRLNENGGRDHWTQVWSGLVAGGMFEGGQVIGESDEHGDCVLESPIELSQLPALILEYLGIPAGSEIILQNGEIFQLPTFNSPLLTGDQSSLTDASKAAGPTTG